MNISIKKRDDALSKLRKVDKSGTPERIEFKKSAIVDKLEPIDRSHLLRANDSQPVVKNTSQLDQWTSQVPANRASILGTRTMFSNNRKKSTEAVGTGPIRAKMHDKQRLQLNLSHEGLKSPYHGSESSFNPVDTKEPRSQLRVTLSKLNDGQNGSSKLPNHIHVKNS